MHTEAITSQAAFTGSPRCSATSANAIAPSTATAAHNSFFQIADVVVLSLFIVVLQTKPTFGDGTRLCPSWRLCGFQVY